MSYVKQPEPIINTYQRQSPAATVRRDFMTYKLLFPDAYLTLPNEDHGRTAECQQGEENFGQGARRPQKAVAQCAGGSLHFAQL